MRLHLVVAALAFVAIAGCDRNPAAGTVRHELVGGWAADARAGALQLATGPATGSYADTWGLGDRGTYEHDVAFIDIGGNRWLLWREEGTWRATATTLVFQPRFYAANSSPPSQGVPVEHAVQSPQLRYDYTLAAGVLTFYPQCPADAVCDGIPTVLHRLPDVFPE